MSRAGGRLLVVLLAAGCATNIQVDPQGFRCDPGNVCPTGYQCLSGACAKQADACAGVQCDQGPAAMCNGTTARVFVGRCDNGSCMYDAVDTACAKGCTNGACVDACAGVTCLSPPVTTCIDPMTLRTFAQTGTCSAASGMCSYTSTDVSCPMGCSAGQCHGANLCANVTCDAPPMPVCMGNTARTFAATGTCTPATGQCAYAPTDTVCPQGCQGGLCTAPALTFTQVGPAVRFAINALDVAPGGGTALAVGNAGRLARWNGTAWNEVTTPSTAANLSAVQFVAPQVAFVVGANHTAWSWRSNTSTLAAQNLSGPSTDLVAVSGRSESNVLVADAAGNFWKLGTAGWSNGALPSGDGPFSMTSAYIDESARERIAGTCNGSSCVAYRNGAGWIVDTDTDSLGFDALGGSFTPATMLTSEVLVGRSSNALSTHSQAGVFVPVFLPTTLEGDGVVGLSADVASPTPTIRSVYALTSSTNLAGHLYQLTRSITAVTANPVLDLYMGNQALSPTVSTQGVLVAEVNRTAGSNNVFRHSSSQDDALDIGEDFAGVSADPTNALVAVSIFGDLARRGATASTWTFTRAPALAILGVEARNGTSVLLVGKDGTTGDGVVERWTAAAGYTRVSTQTGTVMNAVCRVSDTEGWAVGNAGTLLSVDATGAHAVASNTTADLLSVDCSAGSAIACGTNGTVLRYANGAWAKVTPDFPLARTLSVCRQTGSVVLVGGDNVFASLANGAWTQLPAKGGLTGLVARSAADVYASVLVTPASSSGPGSSAIYRFDGTRWSANPLASVSGVAGGGVQIGARVVFGGTGGVLVEGR